MFRRWEQWTQRFRFPLLSATKWTPLSARGLSSTTASFPRLRRTRDMCRLWPYKSKAIFCCIRSVTHFTDNLHCNFTIECLEDNRDILRCLHRVFSYVETVFHFHNLYKKEVNLQKLFVCFLSYQNTFLLCIS